MAFVTQPAQPGDLFVLLAPGDETTGQIRQWQALLAEIVGGHIIDPVHVTCQRFRCEDAERRHQIWIGLQSIGRATTSIAVQGVALQTIYSTFRQTRILKCKIQPGNALLELWDHVNILLAARAIEPHYTRTSNLVTVLSDVSPHRLHSLAIPDLPDPLFWGQRLILSQLTSDQTFATLVEFPLQRATDAGWSSLPNS